MPYFLEYFTGVSAGCFIVEALDAVDALAKARDALRGLDCLSAALLFSPDPKHIFGRGSVIASLRLDEGWHHQNERLAKL